MVAKDKHIVDREMNSGRIITRIVVSPTCVGIVVLETVDMDVGEHY